MLTAFKTSFACKTSPGLLRRSWSKLCPFRLYRVCCQPQCLMSGTNFRWDLGNDLHLPFGENASGNHSLVCCGTIFSTYILPNVFIFCQCFFPPLNISFPVAQLPTRAQHIHTSFPKLPLWFSFNRNFSYSIYHINIYPQIYQFLGVFRIFVPFKTKQMPRRMGKAYMMALNDSLAAKALPWHWDQRCRLQIGEFHVC